MKKKLPAPRPSFMEAVVDFELRHSELLKGLAQAQQVETATDVIDEHRELLEKLAKR